MHTDRYTDTHTETYTHTYTYIHTHTHTYTHMHTHAHMHTNTHTYIHTIPPPHRNRHSKEKAKYQLEAECDSLLPLVFPNYPYSDDNMISSAKIDQLAYKMAELKDVWLNEQVGKMFDRNFTHCDPTSVMLVSEITFRGVDVDWFNVELDKALREAALDPRAHGMEALYDYNDYYAEMADFLPHDLALLTVVIATNFLLTWFHTKSLGLASASIFGVVMTFPLAYCVYRLILQVQWFGILNVVALFVVLGIGADDTFVLSDAWKQSAVYFRSDNLQSRMEYTLRKSFRSILTTSVTSAAAFFANVISDIPPLRLFGILIGSMVVFDFLITVTFLPAVLVCVYRCTPRNTWCFCIKRKGRDQVKRTDQVTPDPTDETTVELTAVNTATSSTQQVDGPPSDTAAPSASERDEVANPNLTLTLTLTLTTLTLP